MARTMTRLTGSSRIFASPSPVLYEATYPKIRTTEILVMIKRKLVNEKNLSVDSEDGFGSEVESDDVGTQKTKINKKKRMTSISTPTSSVPPDVNKPIFKYTNKQRVLVISSRGITARYRHLLEDLKKLIPMHKTDNKLDDKGDVQAVNEIAEMKSCNQVIYLETRKHQDLYMYIGRTPHGPTAKFHVVNIHTMDELKLTGNCMLGSRPILNFDCSFNERPHFQLLKDILTDAFSTPFCHPKSKPFNDRVMSFFVIKNNVTASIHFFLLSLFIYFFLMQIWVRNYQIITEKETNTSTSKAGCSLVEIGPRFVLVPIRIFSGSLGGATLYQNPHFVTPNWERAAVKRQQGNKYVSRLEQKQKKKEHRENWKVPVDELANSQVFNP